MAIDAEFDRAGAEHVQRKRGYVRHNPGDVIAFATTLEVQDHVDLKAMARADGMTIAAFCKKLIARERRRRLRVIARVEVGGVSGGAGASVNSGRPLSSELLERVA